MRIAMWSVYLWNLSPEEAAAKFVEHGWLFGELGTEHGQDLLRRGDPQKVGRALKRHCDELGFAFPQGHLLIHADVAQPDPAERARTIEALKKELDLYFALGVTAAVLHPGGETTHAQWSDAQALFDVNMENLANLATYAKAGGVTLCVENMGGAGPLFAIANDERGRDLAICLDTGHLNKAGVSCAEFVRKAGPRLKALHITDSVEKLDHILPYSAGTVDWAAFVKALHEVGYDGLFNFEIPKESARVPMPIRLAKLDYIKRMAELMLAV